MVVLEWRGLASPVGLMHDHAKSRPPPAAAGQLQGTLLKSLVSLGERCFESLSLRQLRAHGY